MIINGFQSFFNLVNKDNIPAFIQLKNCIVAANSICNCQKSRKNAKIQECENTYINLVRTSVGSMIDYFKSKTNDSEIIFYHGGSHEILRLKLR